MTEKNRKEERVLKIIEFAASELSGKHILLSLGLPQKHAKRKKKCSGKEKGRQNERE